jgi:glutathione reductase (NADPH)
MNRPDYDLIVIGAGSGGVRAARIAGGYGAKVAIVEDFRVGGTCVIRGCVPKKLYVLASRFRDEFEDSHGFGWRTGPADFDWSALVVAKEKEITRLSGLYEQTLAKNGVTLIRARASLVAPDAVALSDDRILRARFILIATGGAPALAPSIPGIEHAISSNEIFDLPVLPKRLAIIGSGYIAVEFASLFVRLGVRTTLIYRAELPLRGFDDDLRKHLAGALEQAGVDLRSGSRPMRIDKSASELQVVLDNDSTLHADVVLAATGRRPATQGMGLEKIGVVMRENGAIIVDAHSRTTIPSIYAVGDVTDRINLTPVAIREGHAFADRVFGSTPRKVDYDHVASAVFTTPEIGTVGLSETAAAGRFPNIDVYETSFRPMRATLSGRSERAYMKLVVNADDQKVLGAHIFGPEAGEMIQLVAVALQMGASKKDFDATMAVHPTMAEELVTLRTPDRKLRRDPIA